MNSQDLFLSGDPLESSEVNRIKKATGLSEEMIRHAMKINARPASQVSMAELSASMVFSMKFPIPSPEGGTEIFFVPEITQRKFAPPRRKPLY